VQAAGINPSDVLSARGGFSHAHLPRILGRDFAGRVIDGPDELIGSEVWGSGGDLGIAIDGTHAEYIVIPSAAVSIRPQNLSAEEAAAVGVPFQTAWIALVERGGVKSGQWVIISGATGAVGMAAIEIAAAIGAKVIALVRNDSDAERVDRSKAAGIASLEAGDLAELTADLTKNKGADLAINGVGAAVFQPLFDSLADFGRMSVFSMLSGREVTVDLMQLYRRNITIHGVNTVAFDTVAGAQVLNHLRPLFESGKLSAPKIANRFPLSKALEAYKSVPSGKTVIIPDRLFTS
jgi:NADPH:quinone reductase-like Zn-dependent oxidoreductase